MGARITGYARREGRGAAERSLHLSWLSECSPPFISALGCLHSCRARRDPPFAPNLFLKRRRSASATLRRLSRRRAETFSLRGLAARAKAQRTSPFGCRGF